MQHTVIGMFRNSEEANRAAERLREKGFSDSIIDVSSARAGDAMNREDSPYSVSDESRYPSSGSPSGTYTDTSDTLNEDRINRRRDDQEEGFGESVGRFFRRLFDNEDEVEKYSRVGQNHSIVSVYAESTEEAERAREILDESGAIDVDENANQFGDYTRTTDESRTASDYSSRDTASATGITDSTDKTLPVIEENVNIGKREVESGGVRLRSRIVERPVEENLRLRQERVFVERVPVNRPATDADFDTFREGEIEMTETSEVPVVNKEARVVEEVRLNKEVNERDETVKDTVRKTDVDVENLSQETLKGRKRTKR